MEAKWWPLATFSVMSASSYTVLKRVQSQLTGDLELRFNAATRSATVRSRHEQAALLELSLSTLSRGNSGSGGHPEDVCAKRRATCLILFNVPAPPPSKRLLYKLRFAKDPDAQDFASILRHFIPLQDESAKASASASQNHQRPSPASQLLNASFSLSQTQAPQRASFVPPLTAPKASLTPTYDPFELSCPPEEADHNLQRSVTAPAFSTQAAFSLSQSPAPHSQPGSQPLLFSQPQSQASQPLASQPLAASSPAHSVFSQPMAPPQALSQRPPPTLCQPPRGREAGPLSQALVCQSSPAVESSDSFSQSQSSVTGPAQDADDAGQDLAAPTGEATPKKEAETQTEGWCLEALLERPAELRRLLDGFLQDPAFDKLTTEVGKAMAAASKKKKDGPPAKKPAFDPTLL